MRKLGNSPRRLLLFVLVIGIPICASAGTEQARVLKGIKTLSVNIQLTNTVQEQGLLEEEYKVQTELKLRMAGIQISDTAETQCLIRINSTRGGGAYNISVGIGEPVTLVRNPNFVFTATIWMIDTVGTAIQNSLVQNSLRERVKVRLSDLLDSFLNDYLSVNPK